MTIPFPKPEKKAKAKRKPLRRTPFRRKSKKEERPKREPMVARAPRSELTPKKRRAILERDDWTCQGCGLETVPFFELVLEARSLIPDDVFIGTARGARPALVLEGLVSHDLVSGAELENVRTAIVEDRPPAEVDHIVPLWNQGTNDPANLQTLCAHCHGEKVKVEAGQRSRLPTSRKAR